MLEKEVESINLVKENLVYIWFCLWVNFLLANRNSIFMMIGMPALNSYLSFSNFTEKDIN